MTLRAYNGTNGEDGDLTDDSRSPGLVIFEVSFLVAIIAVSVSGNLLVLACLVVDRKLRTVSNMFVANLAVADVYITGLLMPFVVTSVIVNEWIFGEPYCKIHGFIQTILYTGSFYTHAVIAVNRFCLIAYPSRYSTVFSRRNSIVILTVLWASCAAYAMPQVIAGRGVDVIYIAEIYNCLFDGSSNLTYLYVTAVLAYGLPTVVIIASYAGIYHTVRQAGRGWPLARR
ncbi:melatonin receptor type 1B-B-like [Ptychodera flava]|uniref:melatonin receptor type 1B-B-like n=1 Tax=Ptychodera flava TaxID=63121 RepID=UPI003969BBA8